MLSILSKNNTRSNLINFLFSLIPMSFIAGNLVLNLNILLLIVTSIIFYGKEIFRINLYFLDKIILVFFLFLFFTGIYNFIDLHFFTDQKYSLSINVSVLIKSIVYVRYLALYFVLRYLVEAKIINFKIFFYPVLFFHYL